MHIGTILKGFGLQNSKNNFILMIHGIVVIKEAFTKKIFGNRELIEKILYALAISDRLEIVVCSSLKNLLFVS